MLKFFSTLLAAEIVISAIGLVATSLTENGFWRILAPLLNLVVIGSCLLYMLRMRYSDTVLEVYSLVGAILGGAYFAFKIVFGIEVDWTLSTLLLGFETAVLGAIFCTIHTRTIKEWFATKQKGNLHFT